MVVKIRDDYYTSHYLPYLLHPANKEFFDDCGDWKCELGKYESLVDSWGDEMDLERIEFPDEVLEKYILEQIPLLNEFELMDIAENIYYEIDDDLLEEMFGDLGLCDPDDMDFDDIVDAIAANIEKFLIPFRDIDSLREIVPDETYMKMRDDLVDDVLAYNIVYEPEYFNPSAAMEVGLIPFKVFDSGWNYYELLAFGGAGTDYSPALDAYQVLVDRSIPGNSSFLNPNNHDYAKYIVGEEAFKEVIRILEEEGIRE